MEMTLKLLGLKPLKETKRKLEEAKKLNEETENKIEAMTELLTVNGESHWFLCKGKKDGQRSGDKAIE